MKVELNIHSAALCCKPNWYIDWQAHSDISLGENSEMAAVCEATDLWFKSCRLFGRPPKEKELFYTLYYE